MNGILDLAQVQIKRISPENDGFQYFYGYYDSPAMTNDDAMHLCNRISFMNRLPQPDDICELGWFDKQNHVFHKFATTNAWNFQQGAMLQWNPKNQQEAIYNIWDGQEYRCVIQNVHTKEKRILSRPLANVSPDGNWGLSINFNRIYDFRAGYGYCNRVDPWFAVPAPIEDGAILLNMNTGEEKLIITYDMLDKIYNTTSQLKNAKIVINHITFNKTSNRFLFLIRYFPTEGQMWETGLGTCDLDGNIYRLRPYTYASHYFWKDDKTLLIYADCGEGAGLYELTDETQTYKLYDKSFFNQDIHCSYSPDHEFIIGDGYAYKDEYRPLFLYHIPSGKGILVGHFYAPALPSFDIRSDLHCRWNHAGTAITFDSIHEGFRGLYEMDLSIAMESLKR